MINNFFFHKVRLSATVAAGKFQHKSLCLQFLVLHYRKGNYNTELEFGLRDVFC